MTNIALRYLAGAAIFAGLSSLVFVLPASALTMKQCSAKYQASKEAGTLGNVKWNDFRRTQCAASSTPAVTSPTKRTTTQNHTQAASNEDAGKSLTMKQCSAKYQAAKDAGVDSGIKWNVFRKTECGPGSDPAALSSDGDKEPPAPSMAAPRGIKFPTAISSKYADDKPGKARMRTCLDQYYAAKEANSLNGLKWIQKGGGYYSLCNARLKGTS